MSKIEILGPKQLAQPVLELLGTCAVLHLCPHSAAPVAAADEHITCLADNPAILKQQILYQESLDSIDNLLSMIPGEATRVSYMDVSSLLPSLLKLLDKHLKRLKSLKTEQEDLEASLESLRQHLDLLKELQPVVGERFSNHHLAMVAVKLERPSALPTLKRQLAKLLDAEFELVSTPFKDKSLAVAIIVPHECLTKLQGLLTTADIPEHHSPTSKPFASLAEHLEELSADARALERRLHENEARRQNFHLRWGPYYRSCREWLLERLRLHTNQANILETDRCFVMTGWIPERDLESLDHLIDETYHGQVTLQKLQIEDHELEDVPIILHNPAYFRPFEIFTRLLPLPRYTSFDPTPYLGIFFPIFFGMILGDAGYALVLLAVGVAGWMTQGKRPLLRDASQVVTICAIYTGIFGCVYGEFFGEQGAHLIGMKPLILERSRTLLPMLKFTLAVGAFHILMGLTLGAIEALLQRHLREGIFRLLSLLLVTACTILTVSYIYPQGAGLRTPLLISIGIAIPALIITGGFLAPLEMLKHIGHIISYTRIMAVGMTSVMLAYVANRLAGEAGSLIAGVAVAFLLHLFNLILGVFAPTIHSLRLHYVEFFSKFYEGGGRKYTPINKS